LEQIICQREAMDKGRFSQQRNSAKDQIRINYKKLSADIIYAMRNRFFFPLCLVPPFLFLLIQGDALAKKEFPSQDSIPILLYHRFGPVAADGMTVPTPVFESHLKFLRDYGYTAIPVRSLWIIISGIEFHPSAVGGHHR